MTLEEYIAHFNGVTFWKEFTFAQNKFAPQPGKELELADNLVWLGEYAFILQLKHREDETEDPDVERSWFRRKVLRNATTQVRDMLRFLGEHAQIRITNERGHPFDIRGAEITEITKIIVFLGARALPHDCWQTRYYVSRTAGFMHVLAAHDYLGILEKLRVPEDIRRYFAYREQVIPKLCSAGFVIDESDIMGAYLSGADVPTPTSRQVLHRFVQDLEAFDLSPLIGDLLEKSGATAGLALPLGAI
jgi:hypothetical protein